MQTSFTIEGDASPEVMQEIKDLYFDTGDRHLGFMEEKHSVIIFETGQTSLEVYELPIIEEM